MIPDHMPDPPDDHERGTPVTAFPEESAYWADDADGDPTLPAPAMPDQRVAIVGGCGRVGLPLGIAFAARGRHVTLYDLDKRAVDQVNNGDLPFVEPGTIPDAVAGGSLRATTDEHEITAADVVIIVIGTPVDEYLNPDPTAVPNLVRRMVPHLSDGQLLVLRSTLYPGTTALVERALTFCGVDVATCPERIAEGRALTELFTLPQIVGARSARAAARAAALFRSLTDEIVTVTPEEAEMAKLFTNAWRYVRFAAANQLFMMATDAGLDYGRIRHAVTHRYPRAADLPGAGFAAGPCLRKDTLQLAAFADNTFALGHAAMLVNEGLPLYLAGRIDKRYRLDRTVVGILGMTFKADSDDPRDSLAFKLRKILLARALDVVCHDPHLDDPRLSTLDHVMRHADVLVIGAPHTAYRDLDPAQPLVDIWGLTGKGVQP